MGFVNFSSGTLLVALDAEYHKAIKPRSPKATTIHLTLRSPAAIKISTAQQEDASANGVKALGHVWRWKIFTPKSDSRGSS